jgi:hypothetical protein
MAFSLADRRGGGSDHHDYRGGPFHIIYVQHDGGEGEEYFVARFASTSVVVEYL